MVLVLFRSALRYALLRKFSGDGNIRIIGPKMFDKNDTAYSGMHSRAIVGLSFERILSVENNNIAICPFVTYEVLDGLGKRVDDKVTRQRATMQASKGGEQKYVERLTRMVSLVFPLEVNFSNVKLLFELQHKIPLEKSKERIGAESVREKEGLEKWF